MRVFAVIGSGVNGSKRVVKTKYNMLDKHVYIFNISI